MGDAPNRLIAANPPTRKRTAKTRAKLVRLRARVGQMGSAGTFGVPDAQGIDGKEGDDDPVVS